MSEIVVFLDSIGRTIIATVFSRTQETLRVTKPLVLESEINAKGKISIRTYPIMFMEVLKEGCEPVWDFNWGQITISDGLELSDKLLEHYTRAFELVEVPQPETPSEEQNKALDLFDA